MKIINLFLIASFLFIIACSSGGDLYNPHQGSEGVYMSFLDNAPPQFIYEMQEFPVGLLLQNNGAYDIQEGIITFSYEKDYIEKEWGDDTSIFLEGKNSFRNKGEEETKMFYFKTKKLDSLSQLHDSQIIANVCYNYLTQFTTSICIDPDIFDLTKGQKPCSVQDQSFSGQGAPVGITYLEESISLKKDNPGYVYPTFKATIENLDQGNVINQMNALEYCSSGNIQSKDFNVVEVQAWIGNEKLDCYPNPIKLDDENKGITICKLKDGIEAKGSAYSTLLSMKLNYGYSFSKSVDFTIQKTVE